MYDVEETKRRGYSGKSRVYFYGRERLVGKDWIKRKKEVWVRGGGQCEQVVEIRIPGGLVRCRSEMHDPHHLVKRSEKRDDRLDRLIGLCRLHHDLAHEKRNPHWSKKERAA